MGCSGEGRAPLFSWPCGAMFEHSGCHKRRSAKGVRSLFFVFGTLSVTFWSLFLMLLSRFLPNSFCRTPFAAGRSME